MFTKVTDQVNKSIVHLHFLHNVRIFRLHPSFCWIFCKNLLNLQTHAADTQQRHAADTQQRHAADTHSTTQQTRSKHMQQTGSKHMHCYEKHVTQNVVELEIKATSVSRFTHPSEVTLLLHLFQITESKRWKSVRFSCVVAVLVDRCHFIAQRLEVSFCSTEEPFHCSCYL